VINVTDLFLSTEFCQDFSKGVSHILARMGLQQLDKVEEEGQELSLRFEMDSKGNKGTVVG
jgi:hypothetical protein